MFVPVSESNDLLEHTPDHAAHPWLNVLALYRKFSLLGSNVVYFLNLFE